MESSAAYICKTIEVFQMKIKVSIANKLAFANKNKELQNINETEQKQ